MTLALPVSAEPELYFGEVKTLEDGSKIVSLMVKDVDNLGSCDVYINLSEGVVVKDVTPGDGNNALTEVMIGDIDNTAGPMKIIAWDANIAHSGDVVICNIVYTGNDSNPFEIHSAELIDYTTYDKIEHSGNNDIERSSGKSTINPTAIKAANDSATSVATVSGGEADGEGVVAESTEIVDETNGSSGEDNEGIPGFGLLSGLSVMLIAVQLLRKK